MWQEIVRQRDNGQWDNGTMGQWVQWDKTLGQWKIRQCDNVGNARGSGTKGQWRSEEVVKPGTKTVKWDRERKWGHG
jgi:hypothetical protein